MLHYSDRDQSFEYIPVLTEMDGDSHTNYSISSGKVNSILHSSRAFNDQQMPQYSNRASLNSNKQLESMASLHSFRVSTSFQGMPDNEKTLLEKMALVKSQEEEANEDMSTPRKPKEHKIYIDNVFDCSNSENKSIMISELDIHISASDLNAYSKENNHNVSNKTHSNTNTATNTNTNTNANTNANYNSHIQATKIKSKVKAVDTMKLYRMNTVKVQKTAKMYTDVIKTSETPKALNKKLRGSRLKHLHDNEQENEFLSNRAYSHKEKVPSHGKAHKTLLKSNCHSSKQLTEMNKKIYSSMKKLTNQISIFDFLSKKPGQRVSSLSKKHSTNQNNNRIPSTPNLKQNIHYTGQSSYSTASQEPSKKRNNNHLPTTCLKKKTGIAFVHSFNHKEYLIHNKLQLLKQTPKKANELGYVTQITKRDYSLKSKLNDKRVYKSFRNTTMSNSRSSSKNNQHSNHYQTNLRPFFYTNADVFHIHQSINEDKSKGTASCGKNKQMYTRQYFATRSNGQSKEKSNVDYGKEDNSRNTSPMSYRNIQITNVNANTVNTIKANAQKTDKELIKVNTANFDKSNMQYQTPLNSKPIIQIYKNNIKHITITPISGLKMKMMQLQQQKEKRTSQHKPSTITPSKGITIQNNEALFYKLKNKR